MVETEAAGDADVLDLRDYIHGVWRHRLLIVVTVVVAAVAAVTLSISESKVYKATAQLVIQRSDTLNAPQDAQDAQRNVDTETAVLQSRLVQSAAEKHLGHTPDVSISSNESSDVVSVTASSHTAAAAAADANAYAQAYITLRRSQNVNDLLQAVHQVNVKIGAIDRSLAGLKAGSAALTSGQEQATTLRDQANQLQVAASLNQVAGARLLDTAQVPSSPVSPKPIRNIAVALVLGFLVAVGLALLREFLNDKVETREDLERVTGGLHVLGEIPRLAGWRDRNEAYLVTADAPQSPAAESYRTLRTSVEFLAFDREISSIQVTSSETDEGKTTTLANLALAFARAGVHVTVVCCDLRRPRIHEFFGLPNNVGFTSVLLGRATLADALQSVEGEANLKLLSAGPPPPNPSELLSSSRAVDVLGSIETYATAGLVFIDSPPVLAVGDALIVSGLVDGTLLVAGANSSSRRALQRTVQMLRQVDAPLLGTVLNNADLSNRDAAFGYGYSSEYVANSSNGDGASASNALPSRRVRRTEKRAAE